MIRHLVLFRLAAEDPDQRRRDAEEMRQRLEGLVGVVPGLSDLQVRPDVATAGHWDVALVSHHVDREALQQYAADPRHREQIAWVDGVISERAVVDQDLS